MLTFDTLLKYLKIQQENLDNLYKQNLTQIDENVFTKYINKNQNDTFSLPESFINISQEFIEYYYIMNNNSNSFLYSILYCIDENFVSHLTKNQYIIDLRKKLCSGYYQNFAYNF